MKLVICDDEKEQQNRVEALAKRWADHNSTTIQILKYSSAEALLFHWEEWADASGMILDIEMSEMNGMELAREIRKRDQQLPIAFLTGYEAYVFDGYEVGALSYLLKPVSEDKFFKVLDQIKHLLKKSSVYAMFETDLGLEKVILSELISIESIRHKCVLRTAKGSLNVHHGISSVQEVLKDKCFLSPHRSYIINLAKVKRIGKQVILMEDNVEIPIARGKWESVHQSYMAYFREERL